MEHRVILIMIRRKRMKFRTFYDNFGEAEHKDIHAETFTEPSLTDTSPASFEPISQRLKGSCEVKSSRCLMFIMT